MAIGYRGKSRYRGAIHPKIFVWSHTKKAEVEYFQAFKNYLETHLLVVRRELCWTPQGLLERVIEWKQKEISEEDGDQVWCIFDVDDFCKSETDKQNLLQLIKEAESHGIKIAYANECFELWIVLHFEKPTAALPRGRDMEKKIRAFFRKNDLGAFEKNQKIFLELLPFQDRAIRNARGLLPMEYSKIIWEKVLSSKGNPSTSIHILVEEINRLFGGIK